MVTSCSSSSTHSRHSHGGTKLASLAKLKRLQRQRTFLMSMAAFSAVKAARMCIWRAADKCTQGVVSTPSAVACEQLAFAVFSPLSTWSLLMAAEAGRSPLLCQAECHFALRACCCCCCCFSPPVEKITVNVRDFSLDTRRNREHFGARGHMSSACSRMTSRPPQ
jgi:hypothetical protein